MPEFASVRRSIQGPSAYTSCKECEMPSCHVLVAPKSYGEAMWCTRVSDAVACAATDAAPFVARDGAAASGALGSSIGGKQLQPACSPRRKLFTFVPAEHMQAR